MGATRKVTDEPWINREPVIVETFSLSPHIFSISNLVKEYPDSVIDELTTIAEDDLWSYICY